MIYENRYVRLNLLDDLPEQYEQYAVHDSFSHTNTLSKTYNLRVLARGNLQASLRLGSFFQQEQMHLVQNEIDSVVLGGFN